VPAVQLFEVAGDVVPAAQREQCQVQLGAGLLVGEQDVALARTGGPSGDRAAVDDGDPEPGPRRRQRAGRPDHPCADHDDVGTHRVSVPRRPPDQATITVVTGVRRMAGFPACGPS